MAPRNLQSVCSGIPTTTTHAFPDAFMDLNRSGPFFEADIENSLDWMFSESFDDVFALTNPHSHDQHGKPPSALHADTTLGPSTSNHGPFLSDAYLPSAPKSPLDRLTVPSVDDPEYPDDRWPMEWSAAPVSLVTLPCLGRPEEDIPPIGYYSLRTISDQHISTLTELLSAPLQRATWPDVNFSAFPTGKKLDHCINRYFVHFDKVSRHSTLLFARVLTLSFQVGASPTSTDL